MKIAGIYLAAGNSRRMGPGIHKLYLPLQGKPLGNLALQAAISSMLSHIIVVTNEPAWMLERMCRENVHILSCPNAYRGQSYSLQCGVEKAKRMNVDGVVVLLADQPFVTTEFINKMINCCEQNKNIHFVAASYRGIRQPPVLFTKKVFPFFKALKGDEGARAIFTQPTINGISLLSENERMFWDVDTWEKYQQVKQENTD
ncbi:nucleotidyltransferase family protein [Bacillus sp. DX1.1]|uniref:nucleotidyltransferase family protein n=1 Tax=unclassified Bacillus (in: firmicutes) TaxID=185979 RepID=UPI00256FB8B2|nr:MULTISPECIES: nucleotidyltransferase family protein [unclassified Bacillus (in: firmicutes)]MDM5154424.1 nucleotidyltransferase family protein [Bacillus sp. DX1.1]WJE84042.1 nucleotidyltransferase family protein [Bacillus sp. DX3.1]